MNDQHRRQWRDAGGCWQCGAPVETINPHTGQPYARCFLHRRKNAASSLRRVHRLKRQRIAAVIARHRLSVRHRVTA